MTTVVIPYNDIRDILKANWNSQDVPEPLFVVVNEGINSPRLELYEQDIVSLTSGSPTESEQPIGNWIYANFTWKVILEAQTNKSRERLWQIKNEIRRICHNQTHKLNNFQRLQYVQFSEIMDQQFNVWQGKIDVELVSSAVLREGYENN